MLDTIRIWFRERRRRRLEKEKAEMADLIERAHFCRCMSRFIDSVLSYRERRGYITDRQYRALKAAVVSLERGMWQCWQYPAQSVALAHNKPQTVQVILD